MVSYQIILPFKEESDKETNFLIISLWSQLMYWELQLDKIKK